MPIAFLIDWEGPSCPGRDIQRGIENNESWAFNKIALFSGGEEMTADEYGEFRIHGGAIRGGRVSSFGDHRTVMSLAVAALCAQEPSLIHSAECVSKSYPEFFSHLSAIAGAKVASIT